MKAIINDKLYDTKKATRMCETTRADVAPDVVWGYNVHVYKTKNGRWFEHNLKENSIQTITETEAKNIIRQVSTELYMTTFGEVEEA